MDKKKAKAESEETIDASVETPSARVPRTDVHGSIVRDANGNETYES